MSFISPPRDQNHSQSTNLHFKRSFCEISSLSIDSMIAAKKLSHRASNLSLGFKRQRTSFSSSATDLTCLDVKMPMVRDIVPPGPSVCPYTVSMQSVQRWHSVSDLSSVLHPTYEDRYPRPQHTFYETPISSELEFKTPSTLSSESQYFDSTSNDCQCEDNVHTCSDQMPDSLSQLHLGPHHDTVVLNSSSSVYSMSMTESYIPHSKPPPAPIVFQHPRSKRLPVLPQSAKSSLTFPFSRKGNLFTKLKFKVSQVYRELQSG